MTASSTIVNTADIAEIRLIQLLAKSFVVGTSSSLLSWDKTTTATEGEESLFVRNCEVSISQADASSLLRVILTTCSTITIATSDENIRHDRSAETSVKSFVLCRPLVALLEKQITPVRQEAIGAFTLLVALIHRITDKIEQIRFVETLVATLETLMSSYLETLRCVTLSPGTTNPFDAVSTVLEVKHRVLSMLCTIYNLRSSNKEKCYLLNPIFTIAVSTSSSHAISTMENSPTLIFEQDMVLNLLLPGRNTTIGNLLEYHNLVRLVEMDLSLTALNEEQHKTKDNQNLDVPSEVDKRILYGTASRVLKQVVQICLLREERDRLQKGGTATPGGNILSVGTVAVLEKDRKLAMVNQQRFLLKMLATYTNVNDSLDEEAMNAAQEAAVGVLSDPISLFHEQRGITSLYPVKALELNPETKPLYQLLQIFQQGKLEDYQSFLSSTQSQSNQDGDKKTHSLLTKYGLNEDSCIHHMRLLSLCSLATEHEEIPYDAIASTLQVPSDQVENWVIAAVSSGLISAKMDQLSHVVMVERCVVRSFGMDQWKILQSRLHGWKKNVGNILLALKQQQLQSPATKQQ